MLEEPLSTVLLLHSLLEVLSDVLLVLVPLLVPYLCGLELQLPDGAFNLIVLTDEGHPAVGKKTERLPTTQPET